MPPANRHNPKRAKSSQSLYSLHEFLAEFPSDEVCLEWLWRERHSPDGENAHCPKCEQTRKFKRYETKQSRQSWTCTGCGHHLHPTAGTIFAKSSRPLTDWFFVMFLVSSSRCGISAKHVERELGVNYKSAGRKLNKVRNELRQQDYTGPLSGDVEVDETWIGGKTHVGEMRRLRAENPTLPKNYSKPRPMVLGMVERKGKIRASVMPPNATATSSARLSHRTSSLSR